MSLLSAVIKGKVRRPYKALVHGVEGVGKTTFGAGSDSPLVLCCEDGSDELEVDRIVPANWGHAIEILDELRKGEHSYRTIVVDSVDWLYRMCERSILQAKGWSECPGFGKLAELTSGEFAKAFRILEMLRREPGMCVLLLAHSEARKFSNPAGEDWSRYEIQLPRAARALVTQWSSAVMFARYETATKKAQTGARKGVSSGRRVLETEWSAAWDAKNRYGLPRQLPLDFDAFKAAMEKDDA